LQFSPKPDAVEIARSVQRRDIRAISHYTHIRSLALVLGHGILSRAEMDKRGICYQRPPTTWGNEAKAAEFANYICCGITRPWAMMGKEEDPLAVVCLNPRLLWREGTIFSAEHAGWAHVHLADIEHQGTADDFDALFASSTDGLPSPTWADVLVYRIIPLADFYRVYFATDDERKLARDLCASVQLPDGRLALNVIPFATRPSIFPSFRREG
jgi:hypothetical protein